MSVRTLLLALTFTAAACGGKKDDAPKPAPTPAPQPAPTPKPPVADPPPLTANAEVKPVAIDPATFAAVELPLLGVTVKAPPGATVTEDAPHFGEDKSTGVVVASRTFALHVYHGTVGGEREAARMTAVTINGGTYTETKSDETIVEYTAEKEGVKTFAFFVPIKGFTKKGDQLLCGNATPVAAPEALAPYRAACDTVAKK